MAELKSKILQTAGLTPNGYVLCTIHRDNNTDMPERLQAIFSAIAEISEDTTVVLPMHPRTSKILSQSLEHNLYEKIMSDKHIVLLPPVSFFDMICLERQSKMVMTDSGGVQKEAFFYNKPCLILRGETEWREIVECGAATLTDADKNMILNEYSRFSCNPPHRFPDIFGDGKAAEFICMTMLKNNN